MSSNIRYNQAIKNVLLNKSLYAKYMLRSKQSKDVGLIDLNSDFSNAYISSKTNLGESIYYDVKNFKHRNYHELRLKTFLPFTQLSASYQQATLLNNSVKSMTEAKSKHFMTILNPTKGGFYAHYAGLYGFVPRSQLKNVVAKNLKSNLAKNKKLSHHLYFSNLHNSNLWLKPRGNFKLTKASIVPASIKNNFVMRKKRITFKGKVSFVFIAQ